MTWLKSAYDSLAAQIPCGYYAGQSPATESTALAALALLSSDRPAAARPGLQWLADLQDSAGRIGVSAAEHSPHWPTAWAAIAWQIGQQLAVGDWQSSIDRATQWLIQVEGAPMHAVPELGHDPSLTGWPWVDGTHSWIEPSALALLALKAAGQTDHARAREAVRLLLDRQLPHGGWNYGNTVVLGQELRPHVQPTGLVLFALAGETDSRNRLPLAVKFLRDNISEETTTASLAYGLMGLAAHDQRPADSDAWLTNSFLRTWQSDRAPHKLALLALAITGLPGDVL